jgi:hypothetical protein
MSTLILKQQLQSTQGTLLSRYSIFQIWTQKTARKKYSSFVKLPGNKSLIEMSSLLRQKKAPSRVKKQPAE